MRRQHYFKSSKASAQEAREAIRPTDVRRTPYPPIKASRPAATCRCDIPKRTFRPKPTFGPADQRP